MENSRELTNLAKVWHRPVSPPDSALCAQVDKPVEFEVSMGNFGNKFEDSVMPSPSFTQPTNAVFDGCQYGRSRFSSLLGRACRVDYDVSHLEHGCRYKLNMNLP